MASTNQVEVPQSSKSQVETTNILPKESKTMEVESSDVKEVNEKHKNITASSSDVKSSDISSTQPNESDKEEKGEDDDNDGDPLTMEDLRQAVDELDENLEQTFNNAANSFWSFASSVSGKVSDVVKQQPGLENLRKNVSSRLAPLDTMSRDLSSQINAIASDKDGSIANIAGSVKSVAQSVQRNAVAMEAAILAKANGESEQPEQVETNIETKEVQTTEQSAGILPLVGVNNEVVNDGIAKVNEISNSLGQTMDGLWTGLWGGEIDEHEEYRRRAAENVPKTRLEKKIYELQANPAVYCQPAEDTAGYEEWGKDFNLDDYADACQELLYTHDSIDKLYVRVVPEVVEEDTFWKRYFFAKYKLELEEKRRQKLLEKAENAVVADETEEDGWGDDDDDWGDEGSNEEAKATTTEDVSVTKPKSEEVVEETEDKQESPDNNNQTNETDSVDPVSETKTSEGEKVPLELPKVNKEQENDDDWDDDDWE